jgi:hypothetical protein
LDFKHPQKPTKEKMKKQTPKLIALITTLSVGVALPAIAAEQKPTAGPKGGKMLNEDAPRAEFFVEKDHTVTLRFYGADMKPVPATTQSAVVYADAKSGRAKLEFEKKGDTLVSKTPLPEGDGYNVMVQLKSSPDAKAQNFKVGYHTEKCDKCKMAEYACICPPGEKHDHDEKKERKEGDGHKH